jgi:hypothetical protein
VVFGKKNWEKRRDPRADCFQSSYFVVENETRPGTNECWINNVSVGGIGLESDRNDLQNRVIKTLYKIGSHLRQDHLRIKYAARLLSKWRYGCQFIAPDEQRTQIITSYIDKNNSTKKTL